MGCDVHVYGEKLEDGEWVTTDEWSEDDGYSYNTLPYSIGGRNYGFFGFLSGVRYNCKTQLDVRPLPDDLSPEVKAKREYDDCDGHSDNWVTLTELKELVALDAIQPLADRDYFIDEVNQWIKYFNQFGDDVRIIFWFDN